MPNTGKLVKRITDHQRPIVLEFGLEGDGDGNPRNQAGPANQDMRDQIHWVGDLIMSVGLSGHMRKCHLIM